MSWKAKHSGTKTQLKSLGGLIPTPPAAFAALGKTVKKDATLRF